MAVEMGFKNVVFRVFDKKIKTSKVDPHLRVLKYFLEKKL